MARKEKTNRETIKAQFTRPNGFLSQIKWGESYTSLFLGAVVVIVALVLIFSFFKSRNFNNKETGSTSTTKEQTYENGTPKSYTVKEGDDLWSISEKIYGSGYNWVDLVSANKLENPGLLYVGVRLNVPNVTPKTLTLEKDMAEQANPITGVSYKVFEGDYLWDIALRAYGDGFKWVEIAKVNKIANPDLIYPGNVLKLPR